MRLLFIVLNVLFVFNHGTSANNESLILDRLFRSYEKSARPVKFANQSVQVDMSISIKQLIDVDEKLQSLQTNLWLILAWRDYRLEFSSFDKSITQLIVPIAKIWSPDISLYNSATDKVAPDYNTNCQISNTKRVTWISQVVFTSTCPVNLQYFPFDVHQCNLTFGSWAHVMVQVNLTLSSNKATIDAAVPNNEWILLDAPAIRTERHEDCCPDDIYVEITYMLKIARRPLFYFCNFLLPTTLISIVAWLVLVVSADLGEKVIMCSTILLTVCVFLLVAMEQLHASLTSFNNIPFFLFYFGLNILILSTSLISNICISHFSDTRMTWQRRHINNLASLVSMKRQYQSSDETVHTLTVKEKNSLEINTFTVTTEPLLRVKQRHHQQLATVDSGSCRCRAASTIDDIRHRHLLRELRTISSKLKSQEESVVTRQEWKFAALVIDRFCFWMFSCLVFALSVTIAVFTWLNYM